MPTNETMVTVPTKQTPNMSGFVVVIHCEIAAFLLWSFSTNRAAMILLIKYPIVVIQTKPVRTSEIRIPFTLMRKEQIDLGFGLDSRQ